MGRSAPLLTVLAAACAGNDRLPDHGPPPAFSAALLDFDPGAAVAANAARLPPGFAAPVPTVCAADPSRAFLAELFENGITSPQVLFEWAPVVAGPVAGKPMLGQPELFYAGTVAWMDRSGLDFRPPHPFGFDLTWNVVPDAPFGAMVVNRPGSAEGETLHVELERGLFPDAAFGMTPQPGDRTLLRGSWIFDCGHPPYETEIHPPTFVALARAEGDATVSLAFANPYRAAQLYGAADAAARVDDPARLSGPGAVPFPTTLLAQLLQAGAGSVMRFEVHSLVEATRLEPVTWFVCAPGPRPSASARLSFSYRFVTRTGVRIAVATRGDSGCLELHAESDQSYRPALPQRRDYLWSWDQISMEASSQIGFSIDVRALAQQALVELGLNGDVPALAPETPLVVDQYAPLVPGAGAAEDTPTEIVEGADDQPFPFHGRIRVAWQP